MDWSFKVYALFFLGMNKYMIALLTIHRCTQNKLQCGRWEENSAVCRDSATTMKTRRFWKKLQKRTQDYSMKNTQDRRRQWFCYQTYWKYFQNLAKNTSTRALSSRGLGTILLKHVFYVVKFILCGRWYYTIYTTSSSCDCCPKEQRSNMKEWQLYLTITIIQCEPV